MTTLALAAPEYLISRQAVRQERTRNLIVKGIWVYFLLVLFDGALRKWFLPSLSGPLLILRDPVALWILINAWRWGYLGTNLTTVCMCVIGSFALYTAYFLGHGNIIVGTYGARIFLLHFPLIFVISSAMEKADLLKLARWTVIITIPMTMLIIAQFYSPQTAWINKSVGGEAGGGFSGAMNYFRPPGTFSFTNGNSLFYNFTGCFVIYFWFHAKEISRILLFASTVALLLAVPFSISRTLLFQLVISLLFALVPVLLKRKRTPGLLVGLLTLSAIITALSFTPFFNTATTVFMSRFDTANSTEGGLNGVFLDRFLGGLIQAILMSSNQPIFGSGVGMGTNVGSMVLTGGRQFLVAEGEWGRVIGELGPILGLAVVIIRLKLAVSLIVKAFGKLREGSFMPWMLVSSSALSIAQAGWAQPTSLGFCIMLTGLTFASLRVDNTPRRTNPNICH